MIFALVSEWFNYDGWKTWKKYEKKVITRFKAWQMWMCQRDGYYKIRHFQNYNFFLELFDTFLNCLFKFWPSYISLDEKWLFLFWMGLIILSLTVQYVHLTGKNRSSVLMIISVLAARMSLTWSRWFNRGRRTGMMNDEWWWFNERKLATAEIKWRAGLLWLRQH